MKEKLSKVIKTVKKAPQKKHHLDFVVAVLTIPVLLSVIILNYSNLQKNKTLPTPTPMVTQTEKIIVVPQKTTENTQPASESCIKNIGPVSISFPSEGQTVSENPLCINIKYTDPSYCSVIWSYRINGGSWSDFNSNNPCIYNAPNGNTKFELKIQSTVIQKETDFVRNFIYSGSSNPQATPSAQ